jgi:hypothetical protein
MSELREAAQAVVAQWDTPNWKLVVHTGVLIDRLRAALAEPETEAEPVAWQRRYIRPDGTREWQDCHPEDVEYYRRRVGKVEVRHLYAHPPRDEWR